MMSGRRSCSMDYDQSDSSGTDDDLPPTRAPRGVRVCGNGRAASGPIYASTQTPSVEGMVQKLEQEAYTAVLRAFGAQSEVITWAKERLMTDLRKELRVSDELHRECLGKVASDDTLQQIQQLSASQTGYTSCTQPATEQPPASSQSRKKQKTAQTLPPPPASTKSAPAPPKRGLAASQRGKKNKGGRSKVASAHNNPSGRPPSSAKGVDEMAIDPYIGRRVKTRWPEDNTFYEAVITDYSAEKGAHVLVYDMDTENETWEYMNLNEVAPGDLKWVEGPNAIVVGKKAPPPGSRSGLGRGVKRTLKGSPGARRGAAGRGRGWRNQIAENGGSRKVELVPLEDLAKEVDKLGEEGRFESAKRAAKAHEEAIRTVLAEVGESTDEEAESDDDAGHPPSSNTQSVEHEMEQAPAQARKDQDPNLDSDEDETAGEERQEGTDGEHTVGGASDDDQQEGEDADDKDEG